MQTPSDEDIDTSLPRFRFDSPHHSDRMFDGGQDMDVIRGELGYQGFPARREFALDFDWTCLRRFNYARGEIYTGRTIRPRCGKWAEGERYETGYTPPLK